MTLCSSLSSDKGTIQKVIVLPGNRSLHGDLVLEELEVFKVWTPVCLLSLLKIKRRAVTDSGWHRWGWCSTDCWETRWHRQTDVWLLPWLTLCTCCFILAEICADAPAPLIPDATWAAALSGICSENTRDISSRKPGEIDFRFNFHFCCCTKNNLSSGNRSANLVWWLLSKIRM